MAHDGQVRVVPEHELKGGSATETAAPAESFPPKVEVPKSFVREHERLELEAEHLREQLEEYKQYVTKLSQELEEQEAEDVIQLEELDDEAEEEPFRLG